MENVRLRKLLKLLMDMEYFMDDENPAIRVLVKNLVYEIGVELGGEEE